MPTPVFKILSYEIDGVDLEFPIETTLDGSNVFLSSTEYESDNITNGLIENKYNKRIFPEDIFVAINLVYQMHSPIFEKEMKIDGEVYIL